MSNANYLEHGGDSFVGDDLLGAVEGVLVEDVLASRLHHHTTTDGVPWVGKDSGSDSDDLGNSPSGEEVELLSVSGEDHLGGIEHSEVSGSVDDDSLHGDEESSVESNWSVRLDDLDKAVSESLEFTVVGLSDISGKTGTGEVEWVDEAEGGGSSSSSGSQVSGEELPEILLLVKSLQKDVLVGILEGEVQSLSWEVPDDVGEISSPEGSDSLLLWHTDKDVHDSLVALVSGDGLGSILDLKLETYALNLENQSANLEEKLDTLDRGNGGLGDGSSGTWNTINSKNLRKSKNLLNFRIFLIFLDNLLKLGTYLRRRDRSGIFWCRKTFP